MLDVHARIDARSVRATLRALILAGALAAPIAFYAPVAHAQVASIPAGINTKTQLTSDDEKALAAFIDAQKPKLLGANLDDMRSARRDILALLQPQNVSVDFKLKLGAQIVPLIKQLVESGDETKVINGLRMAGELATQQCVEILISKLNDSKTTIRLAAAAGINRALESLAGSAPAMQAGGASSLINAIAAQLKDEKDASAMDPMVRALAAALNIASSNFAEARSAAFVHLATIMAERIKTLPATAPSDREMENLVRAGEAVRDALTGAGGKSIPQNAVKDAAALGGETLAFVKRLLQAGAYPVINQGDAEEAQVSKREARAAAVQLVSVGEATIFYARTATEPNPPAPTKLADTLKSAKTPEDARFAEDVLLLIGPRGALVKTYSFPADQFSK